MVCLLVLESIAQAEGRLFSMVLMIDDILKMFLCYGPMVDAGQIEIKKINLAANFEVVIIMYPSMHPHQIHLGSCTTNVVPHP